MPKIVNHEQRKIQIAEATWNVIVQEGLENASVRNIAKASGLSAGSLRHYFPSQSDLLLFSMELVSERVKRRIAGKRYEGEPLDAMTEIICEMLPLNEEKKVEMEVWFVFSAKALVDARLETLSKQVYEDMQQGFYRMLHSLQSLGLAKEELAVDLEVKRLHALVDGMALHHLLYPELLPYGDVVEMLKHHLKSLCK